MRSARALAAGVAAVLVCAGAAQAATPELSTTNRLQDRREVAAGAALLHRGLPGRALLRQRLAFTGEMGGVWAPPLKLVDGVWFGVGDQWVGPATKFSSGWGYTRYDLPDAGGLQLQRTDFAPDGQPRGALRPAAHQPGAADKTVTVEGRRALRADGRLPVGLQRRDAERQRQPRRPRRVRRQARCSSPTTARCPAPPSTTTRRWSASDQARRRGDGRRHGRRLPRPAARHVVRRRRPADPMPSACDDGPFGKGTGGELRYTVDRPRGRLQDRCGSPSRARTRASPTRRAQLAGALQDPAARARRQDRRARQARRSDRRCRCPATRCCRTRSTGASRTSPTSRRPPRTSRSAGPTRASSSRRRSGTVAHATLVRRRLSRTTRGSSPPTASTPPSRPWRSASSTPIKGHLRALRDISDVLNNRSGDGRPRGGVRRLDLVRPRLADDRGRRHEDQRLQHRRDGQVPQRGRADLALDRRQPLPRRDVRLRQAQPARRRRPQPRRRPRRLARGLGNVERTGMGPEKLDNTRLLHPRRSTTWPTWRSSKHDGATFAWATQPRRASSSSSSTARGGTPPHSSTPTRWSTRATCSRSRSTGSARRRWRPS